MKKTKKLELLESTVKGSGYTIRYEKGNFLGGDCRLREDRIIVVNKFLPIEGKISTIAGVLSKIQPSDCPPDVKKIIEESGFTTDRQIPLIGAE